MSWPPLPSSDTGTPGRGRREGGDRARCSAVQRLQSVYTSTPVHQTVYTSTDCSQCTPVHQTDTARPAGQKLHRLLSQTRDPCSQSSTVCPRVNTDNTDRIRHDPLTQLNTAPEISLLHHGLQSDGTQVRGPEQR